MAQRTANEPERDNWMWLLVGLLALLIFGCMIVGAINAGSGFKVGGQETHLRLESAITNYPFCPPTIPCPISVILQKHFWVVWIVAEKHSGTGIETPFRKLIDIPLWY